MLLFFIGTAAAFHDCVQPALGRRLPPGFGGAPSPANCSGGLCVGMHNGPHEGGAAAYPVGDATTGYTSVYSTMTVPTLPAKMDGICYYIWTDVSAHSVHAACWAGCAGRAGMGRSIPHCASTASYLI